MSNYYLQDFTEFSVAELHFHSETRTDTLSADITNITEYGPFFQKKTLNYLMIICSVEASCHIFRKQMRKDKILPQKSSKKIQIEKRKLYSEK